MLENLRPFLTRILNPIASKIDVNPNIFTIISPFIAVLSAYAFGENWLILGAAFILLSGFLDVIDGAVARFHNRTSRFGAFLDSTMDRMADGIIYIGIIFGGYCSWFVGVLAIHSALTVSYVKARAESQGVECNVGIAERAVRMIILMVGSLIGFLTADIYFTYVIIFLVIISYFTVAQRIYHVWRKLDE